MTISLERLNSHFSRGQDPKTIGGIPLVADVRARMKCWKFDERVVTQTLSADGSTSTWSRNVEHWKLHPPREAVNEFEDDVPSVSVGAPKNEPDDDDPGDPNQDELNPLDQAIADLAPKDEILRILQLLQEQDDTESDDLLFVARTILSENHKCFAIVKRYGKFHTQIRELIGLKGPGLLDENADETLVALANMRTGFDRLTAMQSAASQAQTMNESTTSEQPSAASTPPAMTR